MKKLFVYLLIFCFVLVLIAVAVTVIILSRKKRKCVNGIKKDKKCICDTGFMGDSCEVHIRTYKCDAGECLQGKGDLTLVDCQRICKAPPPVDKTWGCNTITGQCQKETGNMTQVDCQKNCKKAPIVDKTWLCTTSTGQCSRGGGTQTEADCRRDCHRPGFSEKFSFATGKLPFLVGGWIDPGKSFDKSKQQTMLNSNLNYVIMSTPSCDWSKNQPFTYSQDVAQFMKDWRGKGKLALIQITSPPCPDSTCQFDLDKFLFTRCVNYKQTKPKKCETPDWSCTTTFPCDKPNGYTQYDSMAVLQGISDSYRNQVGDFDGMVLDWETVDGWTNNSRNSTFISHLDCFFQNLVNSNLNVGAKKLIVIDTATWGCFNDYANRTANILPQLTNLSQKYKDHFKIIFEIESYLYTGGDFNTCTSGGKKQRTIGNVAQNINQIFNISDKKFSYALFPAYEDSGNGTVNYNGKKMNINPMDEVVANFDTFYNSGLLSLSFWFINYYTEDDLKKLSQACQKYIQ